MSSVREEFRALVGKRVRIEEIQKSIVVGEVTAVEDDYVVLTDPEGETQVVSYIHIAHFYEISTEARR